MSDDPRAHEREFWSRDLADRFERRVKEGVSPADDGGLIPGEHGPFMGFEEWLATQDDEMHERALRVFPGIRERFGIRLPDLKTLPDVPASRERASDA